MKVACFVSLILALVLVPAPPLLDGPQDGRLPLPAPSGPLSFEPGTKEVGLDQLLARLAQLTGQELAMTQQSRQALAQMREPLEREDPVPREEVYTFVEGMLARQGAVIAPLTGGRRPILGVQVVGDDREVPLAPLYVRADVLVELAAHPALHVRLLVNLENMDSRQVQTQIRQLRDDDSGITQHTPVGDRALILQGRASEVASLARLLVDADTAAGKRPAPVPEGLGE